MAVTIATTTVASTAAQTDDDPPPPATNGGSTAGCAGEATSDQPSPRPTQAAEEDEGRRRVAEPHTAATTTATTITATTTTNTATGIRDASAAAAPGTAGAVVVYAAVDWTPVLHAIRQNNHNFLALWESLIAPRLGLVGSPLTAERSEAEWTNILERLHRFADFFAAHYPVDTFDYKAPLTDHANYFKTFLGNIQCLELKRVPSFVKDLPSLLRYYP